METPNEIQELEAQIEAILFTMGEAVEAERIAVALGHDVDTVRRVARNMMDRYRSADRGIQIIELNDSYQMSTKQTMYESIIKIAPVPKKHVLTEVLLETLSIVAYKQPAEISTTSPGPNSRSSSKPNFWWAKGSKETL